MVYSNIFTHTYIPYTISYSVSGFLIREKQLTIILTSIEMRTNVEVNENSSREFILTNTINFV